MNDQTPVLWLLKTTDKTLLPFYAPIEWSLAKAFTAGEEMWKHHLEMIRERACTCFPAPSATNVYPGQGRGA